MRAVALVLLTVPLLARAAPAQAQQADTATLTVRVTDAVSGLPVAGALLQLRRPHLSALTDSAGLALLRGLKAGREHVVAISALGYEPEEVTLTLDPGRRGAASIQLPLAPIPLPAMSVTGERREAYLSGTGFYERSKLGGGTFVSGAKLQELEKRTNQLTDALRTAPGFTILPNKRGTGLALLSSRGRTSLVLSCYPQVYLDGIKIPYPSDVAESFDDIARLGDVAGIEAYPGSMSSPIEYGRHPCGTVLIWTRHGPG